MSAAASATERRDADSSPEAAADAATVQELAEREMYRWMRWLGVPALAAAIFIGIAFATDVIWWIVPAVVAILGVITNIVLLAMSSDTTVA